QSPGGRHRAQGPIGVGTLPGTAVASAQEGLVVGRPALGLRGLRRPSAPGLPARRESFLVSRADPDQGAGGAAPERWQPFGAGARAQKRSASPDPGMVGV